MHTIKLHIEDKVFDKVIFFLQNLPKNEVSIIESNRHESALTTNSEDNLEIKAFSNHSANLIEEWKDSSEDNIWK
jgi:hypothetical protein